MEAVLTPGDAPRYRAVNLARKSFNLKAGIEDAESGQTIRVANASMARFLADRLNAELRGEPLHAAGRQHVPIRFQIFHNSRPSSGAGVMYVHGSAVRVVAWADRDEVAGHVARLLILADYPMREHGIWSMWFPPVAGQVGADHAELPAGSLVDQRPPGATGRRRAGALLVGLASLVPLVAVVVLAAVAVGWEVAAVFVVGWLVMLMLLHWLARR